MPMQKGVPFLPELYTNFIRTILCVFFFFINIFFCQKLIIFVGETWIFFIYFLAGIEKKDFKPLKACTRQIGELWQNVLEDISDWQELV